MQSLSGFLHDKKKLSFIIILIAIIGLLIALTEVKTKQDLRQHASSNFTCAINPNQVCSSQSCAAGQTGSGSCAPGSYCCLQNNNNQAVISFTGQMTQNADKGNTNLLSHFFIHLNTMGEAINKVSFNLMYPPALISNKLFMLPQTIFSSQTVSNSNNNNGQIYFAMTNTSTISTSINANVVGVYFQNLVSPINTAFEVTNITLTRLDGSTQTIPDIVSPIFIYK